jgi:hypothetical protein
VKIKYTVRVQLYCLYTVLALAVYVRVLLGSPGVLQDHQSPRINIKKQKKDLYEFQPVMEGVARDGSVRILHI